MACHHASQRLVGPSFNEIAARFAGAADAQALLAKKIRDGGSGNWGKVPMPAHPQLSDVELGTIVSWVLQQR
jgi:cytochrome c